MSGEITEVLQQRQTAFKEREVVAICRGLADGGHVGRDAWQPDVEQEGCWVVDEGVVFVVPHEGVLLSRLKVLKADVRGDVDAGHAVVSEPDGLREPGPDVDHVADDGVPVEVGGAFPRRGERCFVIVRDLLAGVAGIPGGELGDERADGHAIGLAVSQSGDVAV